MSSANNNVIQFPGKVDKQPDDTTINGSDYRNEAVEGTISQIFPWILSIIEDEGYDIAEPDNIENIMLLNDSIRSAIYNIMDIYHPLQDFSAEAYAEVIIDDGATGIGLRDTHLYSYNDNEGE
jgi:hypothetical protein